MRDGWLSRVASLACSARQPCPSPSPERPVGLAGSTRLLPPTFRLPETRAHTDLGPLQHLPFVQHLHGKNLPTVPLPHHSNLRTQGEVGSAQVRGNPLCPPPQALCSPPQRPLGRSPSGSQNHLAVDGVLSPWLRRDWLRGQSRVARGPQLPLTLGKLGVATPTSPGQGGPPQGQPRGW